ncbi:MAG: hypothetical protein IPM39_26240 [Chloroflexi bacterium]|nr:hypothetical protein [Chloroflexota bacterium]
MTWRRQELLLTTGRTWSEVDVAELLRGETAVVPALTQPVVELRLYDQLLVGGGALSGGALSGGALSGGALSGGALSGGALSGGALGGGA